ncbi:MAG: phage terminase large subunit family protein [Chitinophagaceae bacterium]|nr:phage terminase large subunit family protein [Chitinophagaceae bacterium]
MQQQHQTQTQNPLLFSGEINAVITDVLALLKPRIQLLPADWADTYFKIPDKSAKGGSPWVTSDVEYTREILNSIVDPNISEIYIMTSSQILKTTMGMIIITYYIDYDPSPMMILLPTIDFAEKYSRLKLEPVLNQIETIKDKISPRRSRDAANTMRFKEFPGGFLILAGSNSPVDLSSFSIKILYVDEPDRMPGSVGVEGDPGLIAEQRIESYKKQGYKIIYTSSPTDFNNSRIYGKVLLGDQQNPFVKCPACGFLQVLEFFPKKDTIKDEFYGGVIWDKDKDVFGKTIKHHPETSRYICANIDCKTPIYETQKKNLLSKIYWTPTATPVSPKIRSFVGLSRMYSTLSTWAQMAEEWIKVKDDPESIPVFTNTVLGKPYKSDDTPDVDEKTVMSWAEDYLTEKNPNLPNDILMLTCSVDTHPDRLEVEVDGWGIGEENWIVHYEQLWGDPDQDEVKIQLDELLERKWIREDGTELSIGGIGKNGNRNYCTVIDTGGYLKNTQSIYDYTRERFHLGVMAIKGRGGNGMPILLSQSRVGKLKNTPLQNIGTDTVKEIIWNRLKYKPGGPKTIHYTKAFCDYKYYEGLFCEPPFAIINKRTNTKTIIWKKKNARMRNEPWDLKCYNYVALKIADPDFAAIKESLLQQNKNKEQTNTIPQNRVSDRMRPINSSINDFVNSWRK